MYISLLSCVDLLRGGLEMYKLLQPYALSVCRGTLLTKVHTVLHMASCSLAERRRRAVAMARAMGILCVCFVLWVACYSQTSFVSCCKPLHAHF